MHRGYYLGGHWAYSHSVRLLTLLAVLKFDSHVIHMHWTEWGSYRVRERQCTWSEMLMSLTTLINVIWSWSSLGNLTIQSSCWWWLLMLRPINRRRVSRPGKALTTAHIKFSRVLMTSPQHRYFWVQDNNCSLSLARWWSYYSPTDQQIFRQFG